MIPELLKKIDQVPLWSDRFYCSPPEATPKGVSLVFGNNAKLYQATALSGPGTEAGPQDPVNSSGYWLALIPEEKISGPITLYMSATGNNSDGSSYANGFTSFKNLLAYTQNLLGDGQPGTELTVQMDASTFPSETAVFDGRSNCRGFDYINIYGAGKTTVKPGGDLILRYGRFRIGNIYCTGTYNVDRLIQCERSHLTIPSGMTLYLGSAHSCVLSQASLVQNYGTISFSGNSYYRMDCRIQSIFHFSGTVVFESGATGNVTANAYDSSAFSYTGTISGTTTGLRFQTTTGGIINTNGSGVNFFPGNAVGTNSSGGQYF